MLDVVLFARVYCIWVIGKPPLHVLSLSTASLVLLLDTHERGYLLIFACDSRQPAVLCPVDRKSQDSLYLYNRGWSCRASSPLRCFLLCSQWSHARLSIRLAALSRSESSRHNWSSMSNCFSRDRKSTRLNSSHSGESRMPSSA